jgi:homoserine kinase type II
MGFPFPNVLASGKVEGHDALLTSFQTGKVITSWTSKEYEKVGLLLGSLHLAGSEFTIEEAKPPLILSLQYDFKEIAPRLPKEFQSIEKTLDELQSVWPMKLPSGLIHNDIWYKNILFNENKIAAVLDFTMPACDLFVLDLATLIKGIYFSSHSPSPNDDLNCFLTHYQKARPLSSEELDSLETMIQCKILYTIIYMLKKSLEHPAQKENFLNLASFNLLKLEDSKHISFAKILT